MHELNYDIMVLLRQIRFGTISDFRHSDAGIGYGIVIVVDIK